MEGGEGKELGKVQDGKMAVFYFRFFFSRLLFPGTHKKQEDFTCSFFFVLVSIISLGRRFVVSGFFWLFVCRSYPGTIEVELESGT